MRSLVIYSVRYIALGRVLGAVAEHFYYIFYVIYLLWTRLFIHFCLYSLYLLTRSTQSPFSLPIILAVCVSFSQHSYPIIHHRQTFMQRSLVSHNCDFCDLWMRRLVRENCCRNFVSAVVVVVLVGLVLSFNSDTVRYFLFSLTMSPPKSLYAQLLGYTSRLSSTTTSYPMATLIYRSTFLAQFKALFFSDATSAYQL